MDERILQELMDELKAIKLTIPDVRTGIVTTASPLAVTVGASGVPLTGLKRLSSYTPTAADQVSVLFWGNDVIVLGKIV